MSTSPRARARRIIRWMERDSRVVTFRGQVVFSQGVEERIAEEIAEALDELREGFLRKTRTNEAKTHG